MQPALDLCDTFEINKLNMEMLLRKQPPDVFCKKVFLDISQISQENTCARISFLIKLQTKGNILEGGGGGQNDPLPKNCHTYLKMMKFDAVVPYLKKIKKT